MNRIAREKVRAAAGIASDKIVMLGCDAAAHKPKHKLRLIEIRCEPHRKRIHGARGGPQQGETLLIATDLLDLPAEVIGLIFKCRWEIEIFFRFFKHILGCRHLLDRGQASRAELTRHMGVSPTTASKTVARLVEAGLLEELGIEAATRAGRPGRIYRLGSGSVQVLAAAIDVRRCCVLAAGLDGRVHPDSVYDFPTPQSYEKLVEAIVERAQHLMQTRNLPTLGMGISVPGGIDYRRQRVLLSPNLHMTDGRSPGADVSTRLGIETVLVHEIRGACLAERTYGVARGMTNFVMVWAYAGFGTAAVTDGRLLHGQDHMAGELGHITVDRNGIKCGCGNIGCLETVATDAAFARAVSKRLGRHLDVDEILRLIQAENLDVEADLNDTIDFLSIGIAAAVNIFNPEAVLVCASLLDAAPDALERLSARVAKRTLAPLMRNCRVLRARGDTRQGAVASIIHHLTHALAPDMA